MKKLRLNHKIQSLAVRVIGAEGEQCGVMTREKAIEYAVSKGLDLVEVSPKAQPPVCKVMDYGKYLYKLKKIDQNQRKQSKQMEVKGIRLGLSTGLHDLEVKANQAKRFLGDKNVVKVSLIFKGREIAHKELGIDKMLQFARLVEEVGDTDGPPRPQGYQMNMIITPKKSS